MSIQNKVELYPLFSNPVFVSNEHEDYCFADIVAYCQVLEYRSNAGGNFASIDTNILENPVFSKIKELVWDAINHYTKGVMRWEDHEFFITQSWVNVNPTDTYHHIHHHNNSIVSGVFYLQTNKNETITFHGETKSTLELTNADYNLWNSKTWNMDVKDNTIAIFPSLLAHSVKTNTHQRERISIAFNIFVRGKIGSEEALTLLEIK
jgi:uncharacterized protein (TIGR02466 family)